MRIDYTYDDIVSALINIGIKNGDDIFIHSNLGFFGMLDGCCSGLDICCKFERAMMQIIGDEGTLIVPTFSYSYCHGELYNPLTTKTKCGMFSEYIMKKYPQNRTLDPNFSVCGIGNNILEYLKCDIHESFGANSFWQMFMKNNGKIICMNFDSGSTFIHYIERCNNVEYRYNKAFNGVSFINGKYVHDYAVHFVNEGNGDESAMERIDKICKENNISKQTILGKGTILAFPVKRYFCYFSNLVKERPRVLCAREEKLV